MAGLIVSLLAVGAALWSLRQANRAQETAEKAQQTAERALREAEFGPTRELQLERVKNLGMLNEQLGSVLEDISTLMGEVSWDEKSVNALAEAVDRWKELAVEMGENATIDDRLQTLLRQLHEQTTERVDGPVCSLAEMLSFVDSMKAVGARQSPSRLDGFDAGKWHQRASLALSAPLDTSQGIKSRVEAIAVNGLGSAPDRDAAGD